MLDATVLFAGTVWPRWSYEVLRHAAREDFSLVLSPLVIRQARQNLVSKFPSLASAFDRWLELCPHELASDPSPDDVVANLRLVRQPEDVPVALAAIGAGVDVFVSDDKDFTEHSDSTQAVHRRLHIMRPVIFLREVMGWSQDDLEGVRHRVWPLDA